MILDSETAKQTAALLLQINAIKLRPENPFSWASGWKSPIYCDNRIVLSFPEARKFVATKMAAQIKTLYPNPDAIAGVATGAIGMGLLVAEILDSLLFTLDLKQNLTEDKTKLKGSCKRMPK
jgi:orotate phosphoribosyltransferase